MLERYINILGKINLVNFIIISILFLYSGFLTIHEPLEGIRQNGNIWDYLFFWKYLGAFLSTILIATIILYYGGFFYLFLGDYKRAIMDRTNFKILLNVVLIISTVFFIYGCMERLIIVISLMFIPMIYYYSVLKFVNNENHSE